jgi:DNA-binding NarL/FixJ family response regulator
MKIALMNLPPFTSLGIEVSLSKSIEPVDFFSLENSGNRKKCIELVRSHAVDLVIFNPYQPNLSSGLKFCTQVKELPYPPRILAFCEFTQKRDMMLCCLSGVDGFFSPQGSVERLGSVVLSTLDGVCEWVYSSVESTGATEPDGMFDLTRREQEVLWMVSDRYTNEQIGHSLSISPNTVKNHVASILRKMGAKRRSELFSAALHRA